MTHTATAKKRQCALTHMRTHKIKTLTCLDPQECHHTKTHKRSPGAYMHKHTQGHFSLWLSSTRPNTHTHMLRWRPDGITVWDVGLSHSGDFISLCFLSFTNHFCLFLPSNLLTLFFINKFSTQFHFFFVSDLLSVA